jgi:RecA-family ATPase
MDGAADARRDWVAPPSDKYKDAHPDWDKPAQGAILSISDFMAGFEPPEYVIDGIIQCGRLYALTSPTGHGKTAVALYAGCMVAAGRNLGDIEVTQGGVVYLAGENPDDLRCRMYAACQAYGLKPDDLPLFVLPGNFPMTAEAAEALKLNIDVLPCAPVLIIVDTAAAFFPGDDDNGNVAMGDYARQLRVLTTCRNRPAVMTPAHPVKNPDKANLLPRGGGAFLNEIDANLTLWAGVMGETATLHWQGKIRGADFAPVNFKLEQVKIACLSDRRGRPIMSIVARLQSDDEADAASRKAMREENTVLELLRRYPGITVKDIAINAGWVGNTGVPNKAKVHRLLNGLKKDKLVKLERRKWTLTETGQREVKRE